MLPPPLLWMAFRRSSGEFISAYTSTKWVHSLPLLKVLPEVSAYDAKIIEDALSSAPMGLWQVSF